MNIVSRACLTLFEVLNEVYIAVGAGVVGVTVLVDHGYRSNQILRTLSVAVISVGSLLYVFHRAQNSERRSPSVYQIVLISGCDSGLGFSMALHACDMGFTVIAGFLSLESPGAKEVREFGPRKGAIMQIELDVTNRESVVVAVETIEQFLAANPDYALYAVINNAAVMVFGEFEWQTEALIQQQLAVNLSGTLRLSKYFVPLLRKSKGRLINITSHCSHQSLPGLSVYGATKAGILAFTDSLRVELDKYGVKVISFVPGSFFTQSSIMARHPEHVQEMHRGFTEEQHAFYEDYFQRYNAHLLGVTLPKVPSKIENDRLYGEFEDALLQEPPKPYYKVEPLRYAFYHFLFRVTPVGVRDYLVGKFMRMPEYSLKIDDF